MIFKYFFILFVILNRNLIVLCDDDEEEPTYRIKTLFFSFPERATHEGAIKACADKDMNLVTIFSEEEQNDIDTEINKAPTDIQFDNGYKGIWTGGIKYHPKHEDFLWENDNSTIEYFRWKKGEPNNYQKQKNCIALVKNRSDSKYYWYDVVCYYNLFYICEKILPAEGTAV